MDGSISKRLPERFLAVSIIEDNRYMRSSWQAVLQTEPDIVVLGAYENCEVAFNAEDMGQSDVVIMDIGLPGMSGIEGVKHLSGKFPGIAVIMCTVHDDDDNVFDAICNGAVGYLLKKTRPEELVAAIRSAAAGGSPMTPNIARRVIETFQRPARTNRREEAVDLTPREQEVLEHLSSGKSYAGIADALDISLNGVRFHIRSIYQKLQVHSRTEAIARGMKERIIRPPR